MLTISVHFATLMWGIMAGMIIGAAITFAVCWKCDSDERYFTGFGKGFNYGYNSGKEEGELSE